MAPPAPPRSSSPSSSGLAGWPARPDRSGTGSAAAANTPAGYLLSAQNRDGGFGASPGSSSSPLYPAGRRSGSRRRSQPPGRQPWRAQPAGLHRATASSAPTRDRSSGRSSSARGRRRVRELVGGQDLVGRLEPDIRANGSVSDQVNLTAFAVLALRAAGVTPPARDARLAGPPAGLATAASTSPPPAARATSTTPAPRSRRSPAPEDRPRRARRRAVAFIERQQNRDGGFPSQPGADSNAQSTAWAVQGLLAVGVDPSSVHRAGARRRCAS